MKKPVMGVIPRKTWQGPPVQWDSLDAHRSLLHYAYRDGDVIVTPGYHNDPQGDAMSWDNRVTCGDPRCPQCFPQTAASTSNASLGSLPSWASAGSITVNIDTNAFTLRSQDLGLPKQNKEQSMSPNAQRVVADLQSPAISREIDNIKARRKDSIEENLDGVARMALMDKSTKDLRPFDLAYFKDGKVNTVQGVELGHSSLVPEGEETKEHRIYVFGRDYPVTGTHYTMKGLENTLENNNIPYALVYRNKD